MAPGTRLTRSIHEYGRRLWRILEQLMAGAAPSGLQLNPLELRRLCAAAKSIHGMIKARMPVAKRSLFTV
jgi:hypothetical protein